MVLDVWRLLAARMVLGLADYGLTTPLARWTWAGPGPRAEDVAPVLEELRPADHDAITEMMAGRYLLASRLVDTHGASPFVVLSEDSAWHEELQTFAWLRHFQNTRDPGERRFARTLVLDWIGRENGFSREHWTPALTGRRVLNWLRHFSLLIEEGSEGEIRTITRSLGRQIQALRLRGALASAPLDRLYAAIGLAGVALCDGRDHAGLGGRVGRLIRRLEREIDAEGLHKSRCAAVQLDLLVELVSLHKSMETDHADLALDLGLVCEAMQRAFDAISLGTGEPGYFNGTGQLPHDVVVSVKVQSTARFRTSGTLGGYGRLVSGRAVVVADGGMVPAPAYARRGHASALAFEFSHGPELLVGNCGPAPVGFPADPGVFRQGIAHSGPTINGVSSARIGTYGPARGLLRPIGAPGTLTANPDDQTLVMTSQGYVGRFHIELERRLTLLAEGKSLVGQDRMLANGWRRPRGTLALRFHLGVSTDVLAGSNEDMVRLRLKSGAVWRFLWDGAAMRVEESIRQSAYFGFQKIGQIVLEAPVKADAEVAWIFTLEEK